MDDLLRTLEQAREELDSYLFMSGGCDHSVGICVCSTKQVVNDLEIEIGKQFGFEPRKHTCVRCKQDRVAWYAKEEGDDICEPCHAEIEDEYSAIIEEDKQHQQEILDHYEESHQTPDQAS